MGRKTLKKNTHNPRERNIPAYTLRMREREHTVIEDQREREMGKERKERLD